MTTPTRRGGCGSCATGAAGGRKVPVRAAAPIGASQLAGNQPSNTHRSIKAGRMASLSAGLARRNAVSQPPLAQLAAAPPVTLVAKPQLNLPGAHWNATDAPTVPGKEKPKTARQIMAEKRMQSFKSRQATMAKAQRASTQRSTMGMSAGRMSMGTSMMRPPVRQLTQMPSNTHRSMRLNRPVLVVAPTPIISESVTYNTDPTSLPEIQIPKEVLSKAEIKLAESESDDSIFASKITPLKYSVKVQNSGPLPGQATSPLNSLIQKSVVVPDNLTLPKEFHEELALKNVNTPPTIEKLKQLYRI